MPRGIPNKPKADDEVEVFVTSTLAEDAIIEQAAVIDEDRESGEAAEEQPPAPVADALPLTRHTANKITIHEDCEGTGCDLCDHGLFYA